jgi:hypothetical protein
MAPWCRKARPITLMCPVEPGSVDSLKATLAALAGEDRCILRRTGTTHFGRWVVIERLRDEDGLASSDELSVPYLLFTSNIDGTRHRYLRKLVEVSPQAMHRIWSHCIGYPLPAGDAALVDFLSGMQIRTNLFFSPYPRASVRKVSSVVSLRKSFIDFAVRTDGMAADSVVDEFRTWYAGQAKKVSC